ncbi:MAG: ABC transporter permease [Acidobacteria bacterium]|nr:ABC transporter permease [Acidobacteriota bacterium]
MGNLLQDIRYAIRTMYKKPGLTLGAMVALILAIGANTAMFTVVNAVLLRPLPYTNPENLVILRETNLQKSTDSFNVSLPNLRDWQEQGSSFEQLAAYKNKVVNLSTQGQAERLQGTQVSTNLFPMLAAKTALGRPFVEADGQASKGNVVILSYNLWQRNFAANPAIVEQPITLDGQSYTVIGVMPKAFQFPPESQNVELWMPLMLDSANGERASRQLQVIGRLKPGVSATTAQVEMNTVAQRLALQYPDSNNGWGVQVEGLHDNLVKEVRPALYVLMGAVVFVLLIACANVANLLLVKSLQRQKEMAIRTALGASRFRIIRQLLTENILLALVSSLLGLLLAYMGIDLLLTLNPEDVPLLQQVKIDGWVFGFTLLLSLVTALGFGLAPALMVSKQNLSQTLKEESGRVSLSVRQSRGRQLLVIGEIAIAVILLIGAGLMLKSFLQLQNVDPGFKSAEVLTLRVSLPVSKYATAPQWAATLQQILQRLETMPGVKSVGAISTLPLSGDNIVFDFAIAEHPLAQTSDKPSATFNAISPNYFHTLSIPLQTGRYFADTDVAGASPVIIINEAIAKRFFGSQNPLGQHLIVGYGEAVPREIVGVVGNVRHTALDAEVQPQVYLPYLQTPLPFMSVALQTTVEPNQLISAARHQVTAVDNELPIYRAMPLSQVVAKSLGQPRFRALLLGLFALVALAIATVGIYSVMSYSVSERIREIGIRMALGAQPRQIFSMVIGQAMTLVLIGLLLGMVATLLLSPVLANFLVGVGKIEALPFVGLALLLAAIAFIACCIPARRASLVDPLVAMRYE